MAGQPQVRVLLVDAHEEARLSLVRLIQDDTRVIVSAHFGSVPEAAAGVSEVRSDLTVMNVQSHGDESTALCRELHALAHAPVVVLASFMTVEHWRALRVAGAVDYVLKQASSELLCDSLVRLAARLRAGDGG